MRHVQYSLIARSLLVVASIVLSPLANASDSPLRSQLGRWIAIQGELAVREIVDDARRELDRQLQPLRPSAPEATTTPPPPTTATNR